MDYQPVSLLYFGRVGVLESTPLVSGAGWVRDRYMSDFLGRVQARVSKCKLGDNVSFHVFLKRFPLRKFSGRIYSEFLGGFKCPEFPVVEVRLYSFGVVSVWVKVVSYLSDLEQLSSVWRRFCREVAKPFVFGFFSRNKDFSRDVFPSGLRYQGFCIPFYSFIHLIGGRNIKIVPKRVLYCLVNPLGRLDVDDRYVRRSLHVKPGKYIGDRFAYCGAGFLFQMTGFRGGRNRDARRKVRSMYRLAVDLALAAQAFYAGRLEFDFERDALFKGLLWLSPVFWSSDFYARKRSFLSAYKRVTVGIGLHRYFKGYKRLVELSSNYRVRRIVMDVNSTAKKLRLKPPIEKFPWTPGLSGLPLLILECLIYKSLIEGSRVPDDKVGLVLFRLLSGKEESKYEDALRKFNNAYRRRKRKIGLSVRELSILTERSKAEIYEILSKVDVYSFGMFIVDEDLSNGRKIKVLRANIEHPDVKSLLPIFGPALNQEIRRLS